VGYYLNSESSVGRWLSPTDALAPDAHFAHVSGVLDDPDGTSMEVAVAVRARPEEGREIEVFADSSDPETLYFPPLRSFWRFDVDVRGRSLGTHRLRVGDRELDVTLAREVPTHRRDSRIRLTPVSTWRADHIAYAGGYGNGDGTGTLEMAFRQRTGGAPNPLDAVEFRDPTGRVVGERSVPSGVWRATMEIDPLERFDDHGRLVGLWNGRPVEEIEFFYS
jgi:hypothetical protein